MSDKTLWLYSIRKSFATNKWREQESSTFEATELPSDSYDKAGSSAVINSLSFGHFCSPVSDIFDSQTFSIFASTWNVGGNSPLLGLNLNEFLPLDDESDIYFLGFQEIVPLNAGNVLVSEDNEPASKWIDLIDQTLNRPLDDRAQHREFKFSSNEFSVIQKTSLNATTKTLRRDQDIQFKACNCPSKVEIKSYKKTCFKCLSFVPDSNDTSSEEDGEDKTRGLDDDDDEVQAATNLRNDYRYSCVASKQMVGIFVTIWAKRELVHHISHLRISCVGRGIMGRLGNKGCISVSMLLHQTSFCFICSHLASGEKEGDELRRNSDVIKILKNTHFPRICTSRRRRIPKTILDHERVIWLGDLNYRISLSYLETKKLLEQNNWDALLEKDQLRIERDSGRVFNGWMEGKIYFAPTYKYSNNSDSYLGETVTSKSKRRTPAWCDRILWRGSGIAQLFYIRGESRLSDHRPVFSVFSIQVKVLKEEISASSMKVGVEELLHSV